MFHTRFQSYETLWVERLPDWESRTFESELLHREEMSLKPEFHQHEATGQGSLEVIHE